MAGFGVPCEPVDGMDVLAVEAATRRAVARIRDGAGPYFLEYRTYRFRAHSAFDSELYRSKQEVEEWKRRDPISGLVERLEQTGALSESDLAAMEADIQSEVDAAVAFAEVGNWEPVEDLTRFVYTEGPER
jgi:TPP-dependent pyruvate/acetoin dehydrogenase alpha subunit